MASQQNINKFSDPQEDKKDLLVFTNGKGEPKCIDVEDTLVNLTDDQGFYSGSTSNYDKGDFLDACPRVDLRPLTFVFENDGSSRSFFKKSRGVQFTYQVIYNKGAVSAIAPYSDLAVPPAIFSAGTSTLEDVDIENVCNVYFPTPSQEAIGYRFIFREGNDGAPRIIEDIYFGSSNSSLLPDPTGQSAGYYPFKNNLAGAILSEVESLKTFDNLPREASAQEVTEDRLNYGDYKEGFNNVDVKVESSITFYDAPEPGYEFKLNAVPALFKKKSTVTNSGANEDQRFSESEFNSQFVGSRYQAKMGFVLDSSGLPEVVSAGEYDVSITVTPRKNFHLYLGEGGIDNPTGPLTGGSTFSSTQLQSLPESLENLTDVDTVGIPATGATITGPGVVGSNQPLVDKFSAHSREGVSRVSLDQGGTFDNRKGVNRGVTVDIDEISSGSTTLSSQKNLTWNFTGGQSASVSTGRTSTSPLVLKGGPLSFRAVITVPEGGVTKALFVESLTHAFLGLPAAQNPISTQASGLQSFPITAEDWFYKHFFDLGLQSGSSFSHEGSENSDLIIAFTRNATANYTNQLSFLNGFSIGGQENAGAPEAFGIVNKASCNFCLEPARSASVSFFGEQGNSGTYKLKKDDNSTVFGQGFFVTMANVEDIEIKTCIPFPVSEFGSIVSQQSYNSLINFANNETDLEDRLNARRFVGRGTSVWDSELYQGSPNITWPSIQKQLMVDGEGYGPAMQMFDGGAGVNFYYIPDGSGGYQELFNNILVKRSPVLNLPMAGSATGATVGVPGAITPHVGATFTQKRQFFDSDNNGVDGYIQTGFHLAPIGSWLVFDQLSGASSGNWSQFGFGAYTDVPDSPFSTFLQGRPSTMLGNLSKMYEGEIDASTLYYDASSAASGYCVLGYSFNTMPGSGQTVSSLLPRSLYSTIDGYAGPGGGNAALTKGYGYASSVSSEAWGDPVVNGTHNLTNPFESVVGSYINTRGTVTAFGLMGYVDNMPGFACGEIQRRSVSDFDALGLPQGETRRAFLLDSAMSPSIVHSYPRYISSSPENNVFTGQALPYSGTNLNLDEVAAGQSVNAPLEFILIPPSTGTLNYELNSFLPGVNINDHAYFGTEYNYNSTGPTDDSVLNIEVKNSWPQNLTAAPRNVESSINSNSLELFSYSFKTNATHEFGIVYYDEKGRHGGVQPCASVFVPGYSNREGGSNGPARISLKILSAPPTWAEHYRIVYAGNNNVERFLQYTVDGAYNGVDGEGSIYVSLNTLQNSEPSFASNYPAVSQYDGSRELYRFAEGDFMRIIAYSDASGDLIYPSESYEFPIVDAITLSDSIDFTEHPLFNGNNGVPSQDLSKNGQFLLVENNPSATNFSAADIESGSDAWRSRCLVEIVRPKTSFSDDQRPYYETNYGGRILNSGTVNRTHEFNTINILKGDVFYRATPMNVQAYDNSTNQYLPVRRGSSNAPINQPSFVSYYVEHDGFTDFYVSNSKNYGRLHFVNPNLSEYKRNSSISFSEITSPGSYDVNWLSFPQTGNYKDLNSSSGSSGSIKIMDYDGVYMNVFFDELVSRVPYNRNVISSLQDDVLVASAKAYGTEKEMGYAGGVGSHPESVIRVDEDYFFVNPGQGEIVMLKNRQNPVVISDMNISSYFKKELRLFENGNGLKISSGYDPANRELLINLYSKGDSLEWPSTGEELMPLKTIAFDLKSKKFWKSRYGFSSPGYATLDEKLISWHANLDSDNNKTVFPQVHSPLAQPSSIYGNVQTCQFETVLNDVLNESKTFNSVVIDSENQWRIDVTTGKISAPGTDITTSIPEFNRYYEKWYGPIPAVMESSFAPASVDYSQMYRVPTYPLTSHNGRLVKFVPNYRYEVGTKSFYIKMPYPEGHPALQSAIPQGFKNTSLFEVGKQGTFWSGEEQSMQRARLLGSDLDGKDFYNDNGVAPSWSIVGIERNDIQSNENGEVYDLVFKADFSRSGSDLGRAEEWGQFWRDNAPIHDEYGYFRVRDAFLETQGFPWPDQDLEEGFTIMMDRLFSPLYSWYFNSGNELSGQGITGDPLVPAGQISEGLELCFALNFLSAEGTLIEDPNWPNAIYDLNDDGYITTQDQIEFLSYYGANVLTDPDAAVADFDNDGAVGSIDYLALLGAMDTSAFTTGIEVTPEEVELFNIASWAGFLGYSSNPNSVNQRIKKIYSRYNRSSGEGTKMRGRYLEVKCSQTNTIEDKIFGIDVDYDVDIKSAGGNIKKPAARKAKR